jgi:hypothetical protein
MTGSDTSAERSNRFQSKILYSFALTVVLGVIAILLARLRGGYEIGEPTLLYGKDRCIETMKDMKNSLEAYAKFESRPYPVGFGEIVPKYYAQYVGPPFSDTGEVDKTGRSSWLYDIRFADEGVSYLLISDTQYSLSCRAAPRCEIRYASAMNKFDEVGDCQYKMTNTPSTIR